MFARRARTDSIKTFGPMHDIRWIRENPAAFDEGLAKRGMEPQSAALVELDERRRSVLTTLQDQQSRRNDASKEIGKAKGSGDETLAQKLIDEVAGLKEAVQQGEDKAKALEDELNGPNGPLASLPNLPADDVPVGPDEDSNVEREDHRFGTPPKIDFEPKQHFELGETFGLMDFETAAKLSGARFVVLKGQMARLERAITQFMLDLQTGENGYTEINPPLMVRDEVMFGTAQLPKFENDQFRVADLVMTADFEHLEVSVVDNKYILVTGCKDADDVLESDLGQRLYTHELGPGTIQVTEKKWLIPTAEVPLTNLVRESILDEAELPIRVTAFTPCFRAEAGSAGRDTRGMIRQHQFEKVELVSITTPEQSADEHERMLNCAEEVLKRLELPFRVMTLSTGDMGFAAAKTYDIEVWLPGQGTYREISSCSNCRDFQARRMNARYRPADDKQVRHVHTLNGSGLAVGRTLVAILENYQQADGSVAIPDVLRPYMGGIERIETPAAKGGQRAPARMSVGRILVTNDDGINAPGLKILEEVAATLSDDVWTVVPENEQSGASHSLTLSEPLRARQLSEQRFAVRGTPTDCVMMGVRHLLDGARPDLVLSGVNRGQNLAEDVNYSGTVAGAAEGTTLGIPSIALSQAFNIHNSGEPAFDTARKNAGWVIRDLLETGWAPGILLNVNFPDLPDHDDLEIAVTKQGRRDQSANIIEERRDPRGISYYWIGFRRERPSTPAGSDLKSIYDGKISVTPLHLDRTHEASRHALAISLSQARRRTG